MRSNIVSQFVFAVVCVFVHAEARAGTVAYVNPAKINGKDVLGNQGYGGSLGMDFQTTTPILISDLGAFDSGLGGFSGLTANQSISVELFNTKTKKPISPVVTFTKKDPGTLDGSSRFKPLASPIRLATGADVTIVAWGFTAAQPNGNFYEAPYNGMPKPPWTTNGVSFIVKSIDFIGTGRYGPTNNPGVFPTTVDHPKSGIPNPYAAGTFVWAFDFTIPEPSSFILGVTGGLGMLGLVGLSKARSAIKRARTKA